MKKLINLTIVLAMLLGFLPARTATAEVTPLWEQLPNGEGAVSSEIGNTIYADDFVLENASSIAGIEIWSSKEGPFHLYFDIYENNDDGEYDIPGDLVLSKEVSSSNGLEDSICPIKSDGYYYCKYRHTLTLDEPLDLEAGHYWLAVYGSAGSNFGWSLANIPSQLQTYAWKYMENPWDGQYKSVAFAFRLLEPQDTCSASVEVANINDSGTGSLRQAIADVCEGGTITFAESLSGETVILESGQLTIDKNMIIDASTLANRVTVNANANSRVMQVNRGVTATLLGKVEK